MTAASSNPWDVPTSAAPAPYGQQPGWMPGPACGPTGKVRPTRKVLLLLIVTLGIYAYAYNYKIHKEMKQHSGRGIGGGIALLLTFVAGVAMSFVTPAEIGGLYSRRGRPEPVRGWTGLWVLLPVVLGYVVFLVAAVAVGASSGTTATGEPSDAALAGFLVTFLLFVVVAAAGVTTWFVKVNGALNRYWEGVAGG